MTISSAADLKNVLFSSINFLLNHREEYLYHPETAFTRTKDISFEKTILFPMLAGAGNVATELMDFFDEDSLPLPSAMIQHRNQVRPEAFKALFTEFTGKLIYYGAAISKILSRKWFTPFFKNNRPQEMWLK
ncbi:MAG: hypothetical protein Q4A32_04965 [Lachnospiraceae bacterium]|nr:hypothetical protein [Lachnospiraceae bacterium]